jgi:hypothetical protein
VIASLIHFSLMVTGFCAQAQELPLIAANGPPPCMAIWPDSKLLREEEPGEMDLRPRPSWLKGIRKRLEDEPAIGKYFNYSPEEYGFLMLNKDGDYRT